MYKVDNIFNFFVSNLKGIYEKNEAISFAYISIEKILGYSKSECIINSEKLLTDVSRNKLTSIVSELKKHKPIQYILQEANFFNLCYYVNENVLIPRPETEELVEWIIDDYKGMNNLNYLDIGTGSGCIIISLCKYLPGSFFAIDICDRALEIARRNNHVNGTDVKFDRLDIINQSLDIKFKYDVIVSNPPYVLESQRAVLNNNVVNFEPHKALFVKDNDSLIFYKKIICNSKLALNKGGALYFEINEKLSSEMSNLLKLEGFVDIELKKDINNRFRMIKAKYK